MLYAAALHTSVLQSNAVTSRNSLQMILSGVHMGALGMRAAADDSSNLLMIQLGHNFCLSR